DASAWSAVSAIGPAHCGPLGESELTEVAPQGRLSLGREMLDLLRVPAGSVLELGCLADVADARGLDGSDMCRSKPVLLRELHGPSGLRARWIQLICPLLNPLPGHAAGGANLGWTGESYNSADDLAGERSEVGAHIPLGFDGPDIARIG